MRKFHLALLCFICIAKVYGQTGTKSYYTIDVEITKEKKPKKVFAKVIESSLVGTDSSWLKSFEEGLNKIIQLEREVKVGTYTVSLKILVERDGSIADYCCVNDPGFGMCKQVLFAIIKYGPRWCKY